MSRILLAYLCGSSPVASAEQFKRACGKSAEREALSDTIQGLPLMGSHSRFPLSQKPRRTRLLPWNSSFTSAYFVTDFFRKKRPPSRAVIALMAASSSSAQADMPSPSTSSKGLARVFYSSNVAVIKPPRTAEVAIYTQVLGREERRPKTVRHIT